MAEKEKLEREKSEKAKTEKKGGRIRVGMLTSGGDCQALNATMRGIAKALYNLYESVDIVGFRDGYRGLMYEDYRLLLKNDFSGILTRGGTLLGTSRQPFKQMTVPDENGNNKVELMKATYRKLGLDCLCVLGGNGSQKTANLLRQEGLNIVSLPKTIDNDLAITDHTPGFGSAAKYIAASTKEVIRDALGFSYKKKNVIILEIMGRNAGWLVGATALARQEDCDGPDLIYLPELPFDIEGFVERVSGLLEEKDVVVAAVSEGIKTATGEYVCELADGARSKDAFGHIQMAGTAAYLSALIHERLGVKTRSVELSTLQRAAAHLASRVDVDEAFAVGGATVKAADEGSSGVMVVIDRVSVDPYQSAIRVYDVHRIANGEKVVPRNWINAAGDFVTDDFVSYVKPLIQGHYNPMMVAGLPRHLVMNQKNYSDYQI